VRQEIHHGTETQDAAGQLVALEQRGWRITYDERRPATARALSLPHRLRLERETLRLRLLVTRWRDVGP
jgi:outer membrane biogenesis lipoprotein LolB